jgi:hypothetical protein
VYYIYNIPYFIYNNQYKKQKNQFIPLPVEKGDFLIGLLNIALITGIVGAILYFTSNRSVEMLLLSDKYFSTSDPTLRLSYVAIAESYLDIWKGTAFNTYYFLSAISLILFSIEMLKSSFYKRSTGIIGLISGISMVVPSGFGMVGLIMSLLYLVPWIIFSVMVVIRLNKIKEGILE